jgi:hypothetical protein
MPDDGPVVALALLGVLWVLLAWWLVASTREDGRARRERRTREHWDARNALAPRGRCRSLPAMENAPKAIVTANPEGSDVVNTNAYGVVEQRQASAPGGFTHKYGAGQPLATNSASDLKGLPEPPAHVRGLGSLDSAAEWPWQ